MSIHQIIFALSLTTCYGAFAWTDLWLFNKREKNKKSGPYRSLKLFTIAFWTYSFYLLINTASAQTEVFWIGAVANVFSLTLFVAAVKAIRSMNFSLIFDKDVPKRICKNGPYKYIRNPFYLSYLTCYSAVCLCLPSAVLGSLLLVLLALYLFAIKLEENKFIYSRHALEYIDYFDRTGRFFPKLTRSERSIPKKKPVMRELAKPKSEPTNVSKSELKMSQPQSPPYLDEPRSE